MVLTLARRQPVQRCEATTMPCEGQVSAWLKKTKSDTAKLKWLTGSNKRYFTIDFETQVFFYSHSKDQKGISEKITFKDIVNVEKTLPSSKSTKDDGKSFRVVTRVRTFELQASTAAEASQWVHALGVARDRGQIQACHEDATFEATPQGCTEPPEPSSTRPTLSAQAPVFSPASDAWSAQNMESRRGSAAGTSSLGTDPSTGGSTATPPTDEVARAALPELCLDADISGNLQQAGEAGPNSARQPSCCGTPAASPSRSADAEQACQALNQWGKLDELEEIAAEEELKKSEAKKVHEVVGRVLGQEAAKPPPAGSCAGTGPDLSVMPPPPPAPKAVLEAVPPPTAPAPLTEQVPMPPMPPLCQPAVLQAEKSDGNVGNGPDLAAIPPPPAAAKPECNAGNGPDLAGIPPPPAGAAAALTSPVNGDRPLPRPAKLPPVMSGGCGPDLAGIPPPPPAAAPLTGIGAGIPLKKPLPPTKPQQSAPSPRTEVPEKPAEPTPAQAVLNQKPQTSSEKRDAIWRWADQDCDGILNRVEVERFVSTMEGAPLHYQQYVQMCKLFGADHNIGLTAQHFEAMYSKGMSNADEDYDKIAALARPPAPAPQRRAEAPSVAAACAPPAPPAPASVDATATAMGPEVVEAEERVPCPHCGRRFAAEAAARHVPICQRAKAKPGKEKRRTITAVRASSSADASAIPEQGMGEEPSGWDDMDDAVAKAKPVPVKQVLDGPANGQEASGWDDTDDDSKMAHAASSNPPKDSSDDDSKAASARPKKLEPLVFDMGSGPAKPVPKKLAERLSKKRSKKSKDKDQSPNSKKASSSHGGLEPSGWDDEDEDRGAVKAAADDSLDRPASAGFVRAKGKSSSSSSGAPALNNESGEGVDDLLGEIAATDTTDASADDNQLVPDFLCTSCDRQILRVNNHIWNQGVTYMFLRNNYPNTFKLRAQLTLKKGCCAYCCQCSSRSADIEAELDDVANGLRWRVVRSASASAR